MVRPHLINGLARSGPIRILAAGDLVPENDFDLLIRAFAGVARLDPRARLIIVGEGPERDALEALVEDEEMRDYVGLPGDVPPERFYAWLDRAHVFALTRHDGCEQSNPAVLSSAMAEGLSVIASDVGPVHDLIADGTNGLMVPPGECAALSRALHLVVEHDMLRRRLGASAQLTVQSMERRRSA
ncbi:MAG: glycosyltransferase [Planctomycetota bacterium]|nr:glycosyltransferase [Planctomycetota bacterium]